MRVWQFATRAKTIKNTAEVNEVLDDQAMLRKYKKEIDQVCEMLQQLPSRVISLRKIEKMPTDFHSTTRPAQEEAALHQRRRREGYGDLPGNGAVIARTHARTHASTSDTFLLIRATRTRVLLTERNYLYRPHLQA